MLYCILKSIYYPCDDLLLFLCSRWIRLLFGREFPLPSVLEMWDALFADGASLGLIDYIFVAMLMHIREVCKLTAVGYKGVKSLQVSFLLLPPPPPPPSISLSLSLSSVIEGDYAVCMQHLMHFPPVYEVNYLVQRALHLRNPVSV